MPSKAQFALIHIAKAATGLSETEYRDILRIKFQVKSSKDLRNGQVHKLLNEFKSLGWGGSNKGASPQSGQEPVNRKTDAGSMRKPADPNALITNEQKHVLECLCWVGEYSHSYFSYQCKSAIKKFYPQTHKEGQTMIYRLVAIERVMILSHINLLDPAALTKWERGFMYDGNLAAKAQFEKYVAGNNQRGKRTMPSLSLTKLFEILKARYDHARHTGKTENPLAADEHR